MNLIFLMMTFSIRHDACRKQQPRDPQFERTTAGALSSSLAKVHPSASTSAIQPQPSRDGMLNKQNYDFCQATTAPRTHLHQTCPLLYPFTLDKSETVLQHPDLTLGCPPMVATVHHLHPPSPPLAGFLRVGHTGQRKLKPCMQPDGFHTAEWFSTLLIWRSSLAFRAPQSERLRNCPRSKFCRDGNRRTISIWC